MITDNNDYSNIRFDVSTFIRLPFITSIFFEENTRDFTREYFVLYLDKRDDKIKVWGYTARNKNEAGRGVRLETIDDTSVEIESIDDLFDFTLMLENGDFFIAQAQFLKWLFGSANIRTSMEYLYNVLFLQRVTLNNILTDQKTMFISVPNGVNVKSDVLGKRVGFDGTSWVKLHPDDKLVTFSNVNCGQVFKQLLNDMSFISRRLIKLRVRIREYKLKVALAKYKYTF